MRTIPTRWLLAAALLAACGCYNAEPPTKDYGVEHPLEMPGGKTEVWAVAPAINLSGHREVDPILQADLVYDQIQQVRGLTGVPVNRVAQVYAGLEINQVESARQATRVCDLLGADALLVPTVTSYDPYSPPKMAVSLALFRRPGSAAAPAADVNVPNQPSSSFPPAELRQAIGIFDSADGSVRASLMKYAAGRSDPNGPMAEREFFLDMDSYSGFVYHQLIADLLGVRREPPDPATSSGAASKSGR
jgi:hypothetical protein